MEDIDMDLDLGDPMPLTEEVIIEGSPVARQPEPQVPELESAEPVPSKLHIRGLDDLTTEKIVSFATEYYPAHQPKVEWIDDTSANLNYESLDIAAEAFLSLSVLEDNSTLSPNPLQLRATKPLSADSPMNLQIRMAVSTDRKRPRAHEASRFYMLHPELDPREQKRQRSGSRDYRRRRYSDQEHRRRRRGDERSGFAASMYDDDNSAVATRNTRRASHSSFSTVSDENRTSRSNRPRARQRSRSPSYSRSRSGSPSGSQRRPIRRRSPLRSSNAGKELFVGKTSSTGGGAVKELFGNKNAASSLKKELFLMKSGSDRLSGVLSASSADLASETADLFANRMSVPFVDGAGPDDGGPTAFPLRSDGLAAEVKKGSGLSIKGAAGFSIRGAADPAGTTDDAAAPRELFPSRSAAEFSIRGAASASSSDRVRELFPTKVGNKGKELFAERTKNRADMFY